MIISIPAICPTCGAVFPSAYAMSGNATVTFEGCGSGPCPYGHMGIVPNGTYRFINGILQISRGEFGKAGDLERILAIAEAAKEAKKPADDALEEISKLLPSDAAAAIKQLGSKNPLAAILLVIFVLCAVIGAAGNAVTAVGSAIKALFPTDPAPQTIINNQNVTIINPPAAVDRRDNPVPQPLNRKQRRGLKKMERNKQNLNRQWGNHTETKS
jgi:hypothetical protein